MRERFILQVREGMAGVTAAAEALRELRDCRLYRETHKTFAVFCREVFGLTRARVYQKIEAGYVFQRLEEAQRVTPGQPNLPSAEAKNVLSDDTFLPANESQVVELSGVPEEDQPQVWQTCIARAGGKQPTLRQVRQVVGEVLGRPSAAPVSSEQHDRDLVRRALAFLKAVKSPSVNINTAIGRLTREVDRGVGKSNPQRGSNQ